MTDKKAPIDKPLRQAGQSLQDQLHDELYDKVITHGLIIILFSLMIAWTWGIHLFPQVFTAPAFTVVGVIVIVWCVVQMFKARDELHNLKLGLKGEKAVGQALEGLREQGYRVYHDIVAKDEQTGDELFNIDHVLVGPGGVYIIETKTRSKPEGETPVVSYQKGKVKVDGLEPDRQPVTQVKNLTRTLSRALERDTKESFPFRPVVLYPGWWIEGGSSGEDVWVLNEKCLPGFLFQESDKLDRRQIKTISAQLERYSRSGLQLTR